jgi:hypothetical protein
MYHSTKCQILEENNLHIRGCETHISKLSLITNTLVVVSLTAYEAHMKVLGGIQ